MARCRNGHLLNDKNSVVVTHTKTGRSWRRCLVCHSIRQKKFRDITATARELTDADGGGMADMLEAERPDEVRADSEPQAVGSWASLVQELRRRS